MRTRLLVASLALVAASCAWAQSLGVRNGGFESGTANWTCPSYWSGEVKAVTEAARVHGGTKAAELRAVEKQGKSWGRIHCDPFPVQIGLDYRFSVFAKGSGSLKLGAINYLASPAGEMKYEYKWQEPAVALTDQWQQVTFDFAPVSTEVERFALTIEIEGPQAVATLDDADFQVVRKANGRIAATPYVMTSVGGTMEADWQVNREAKPAALPVLIVKRTSAGTTTETVSSDDQGRLHLSLKAPDAPELVRVDVVQRDLGASATLYMDVVTRVQFRQFAALAEQAKITPLPQHWLFLGDSLTDFSRGYNYVDQVCWWLQCANGGQPSYRNAGVGGDYITRSLDRLNGKAGTYRLEAYEGIFAPKPTRVFMMLGHNDSKLTSTSNFTEAVVKPEDYQAQFVEFIGKVNEKTGGAPFTLLSPTSSVYEITKANADKAVAAGKGASLFGKPEVMAQYTALTRLVAEATRSDFIDVFTPTLNHPDKPTLFTADGVHLSLEGNHLLALEILKHLAR